VDDSLGQSFRGCGRVFTAHPDEREQTGAHLADRLTVHADLRLTHPLDYRSHLLTYRES
jgi:hypothetical protein